MNTYTITHDIIGEGEITLEQLSQMVVEWKNDYPGWTFSAETKGNDLRVYCERDGSEDSKPNFSLMWKMFTADEGYITVAKDEKPVDRSTPTPDVDPVSPFFVLSHIASHLVIALDASEAQEDAALTDAKRLSRELLDELLSLYDKRS